MNKVYIAIDLKSFYASVECVERGYNPLNTNLVVADDSRTEKTICLAVSPALKAFGVPGRPRLYEVVQIVDKLNKERQRKVRYKLNEESIYLDELKKDPKKKIGYVVAPPRMSFYMQYSTKIYNIYLKYISSEDIHVYSIDEVFIDATPYLKVYNLSPRQLAMKLVKEILNETGITATVGIGTNMYLAKVAMDIEAKHMQADKDGVRIAYLDEELYKQKLWNHVPLTDFWRVGRGYERRLHSHGLYTMGDVARCSLECEELLYKEFGINAELLIDHAWGIEPCTIKEIKNYVPSAQSLSSGQVLSRPYRYDETKVIVKEMTDLLVLDIVEKNFVTDQIVLTIGYDVCNLKQEGVYAYQNIEVRKDFYGRDIPMHGHGTVRLNKLTSSTKIIMNATMQLFERICDKNLYVRRVNVCFANLQPPKNKDDKKYEYQEYDLFTNIEDQIRQEELEEQYLEKEHKLQEALIEIHNKYGKNAVLKGTNFEEGATTRIRNKQIGGHKA